MQAVRQRAQRYDPTRSREPSQCREPNHSSTTRSAISPVLVLLLLTIVGLGLAQPTASFAAHEGAGGDDSLWWCAADKSASRCTRSGCQTDSACAWGDGASDTTSAILFSDRLDRALNVTLRSVCGFEPVMLIFVSTQPLRGLPARFRACRLLPMLATDIVGALEGSGFAPRRICALDASSPLLAPRKTLLPRSATGGRHIKHALCLNHLRFYLGEIPVLRAAPRAVLLDDDLVLRRSLRVLNELPMTPGALVAANCEGFQWSRPCVGWSAHREAYSGWFGRTEHGLGAEDLSPSAPLGKALAAVSLPPPDASHKVWNFGCTLFNLRAHRRLGMARVFEDVAARLLGDSIVRADSLLYGLGVAYLVYQGRVQCYGSTTGTASRSAWFQLDGLGHIPHHELRELVGPERIEQANVVHYTGERKPWSASAFHEYTHLLPPEARSPAPPPLALVLIAHDSASEALALNLTRTLQEDRSACGSITSVRDRRLEHHPDALMPYGKRQCVRLNRTSRRCHQSGWAYLAAPLGSCQLRDLASWRAIYAATHTPPPMPAAGSGAAAERQRADDSDLSGGRRVVSREWRGWGSGRNATAIFEGYLRRLTRRPTTAPAVPALCPRAAKFALFRMPLDRLAMAPSELPLPLLAPAVPRAGQPVAFTGTPLSGGSADEGCCAGTGCTLVSQSTGWCSGAATEAACHRSRTEGRPCVWAGARCTKGYKFGHGDEPSCPPPAGRLPLAPAASAANIGGGQPARQRVSHFDPRLGATADFVDLHAVLSRLDARVVYLGEDDKAEAPGAAMVAASAGGGTSNTRPVASTLVPRVRIGRRRCQRDLAACRRDVARALGVQFVGPRVALPNDAL